MSDNPVDVLYVITDLNVGGVPLHLRRLTHAMCERGLSVAVVSLAQIGPVGEMLQHDGVQVYACGAKHGWDVRVFGRLAQVLTNVAPRVVHSLLFHANFATRRAATMAGIAPSRVVCEIQTVEVERKWHLLVDRFTHRGCRVTIGNSPSVVEHLHRHARIPEHRLRLVRGGIDPETVQQATAIDKAKFGITGPMILWVGRLDAVKGLHHLIDAFGSFTERTDAQLVLVGDGPLRESLNQYVSAASLSERVQFLGRRDDVACLLKSADLFVFPSRTEGLPNALLEAMAAGCAIVTTDVPGCRDLIQHEKTGLLVPYGDTSALAAAMQRALDDTPLSKRLGANASEAASSRWHIRDTMAAYHAVYLEIFSGN